MEVFVRQQGEELHFGAARGEAVGAVGVARLRVQMLQSAAALSHVDEAVEGVGHVAHHLCGGRNDFAEVALQVQFIDPFGCFECKLIQAVVVEELVETEVAEQQG